MTKGAYIINGLRCSTDLSFLFRPALCPPPPLSGRPAARELKPGKAQRFAWDDPAGVRKLSWNCMEHSGELDLVKVTLAHTETGRQQPRSIKHTHQWCPLLVY